MHNQLPEHFPRVDHDEFVPRDVNPLSFRTGMRFAANMLHGLRFVGGVFAFLTSVLCGCAFLMWIVEEDLLFGDAVYVIAVTALTIGYGDITPQTIPGKCVSVFSGLVGILCTGIVIAVAVEALRFTIRQEMDERLQQQSADHEPSADA